MTNVEIEIDGEFIHGMYREENGVVVVYYNDDVKFADCRHTPSNVAAKWVLADLARKIAQSIQFASVDEFGFHKSNSRGVDTRDSAAA